MNQARLSKLTQLEPVQSQVVKADRMEWEAQHNTSRQAGRSWTEMIGVQASA